MKQKQGSLSLTQVERRISAIRKNFKEARVRPGWIRYMREALGMTLKDLAKRTGVSLPTVAQAEHREKNGVVTIETLRKMAAAMESEFVYAFIPKAKIETILKKKALEKAKTIIERADVHMTLEDQRVGQNINDRVKRLAEKLLDEGKVW